MDPALGADFEKFRRGYLDLDSRKGKAPGGYCSFFPKTGLPYIFMNAVGTESDVRTLLHEGGHAFHGLASSATQPLLWNRGAPMEFNEVASMAMELLALPYLEKDQGGFYTPEEADRARQEQFERIVLFLPYMAVVDGFQHWVYAEAPEDVTAADMDAQWDALWTRFMGGDGLVAAWKPSASRAGTASCTSSPCRSTTSNTAWPSSAPCRSGATRWPTRPTPCAATAPPWPWATRAPCPTCTPRPAPAWPSTARRSANWHGWWSRIWKRN